MGRRLYLVLELDDSEPVSGSLRAADGPERPFTGWLGLMTALKAEAGEIDGLMSPSDAANVNDPDPGAS